MLITIWSHLGDTQGTQLDVPWSRLGQTLEALPEGALFSCATFDGRGEAGFRCATAIVLDHDKGAIPLSVAADELKRYRAILYETKSSTPTKPRWRAILPIAQPITDYGAYTQTALQIASAFACARESATGAQMWFPPRKGFRALSPLDGEPRLMAWINGDYENPLVKGDLPIKSHGDGVDRSVLDMRITTRCAELGLTRDETHAIFVARNGLSHSVEPYHMDMMWRKVQAARAQKEDWIDRPNPIIEAAKEDVPVIQFGPDLHRMVDECSAALARDGRLFTRDAGIVELLTRANTIPVTRALSAASIQDRLTKSALFVRGNKEGDLISTAPPRDLAEMVRDRGTYPALRHLRGIAEVPILRGDGSIADAPGYDEVTEFYRAPGLEINISRQPREALAILREPFSEFPWAEPGMIDIPVALVCAVVCRAAVGGNVPLFVFDAAKSGSGKSLIVETISAIVSGTPSGANVFPANDEELAKNLSGYARASKPLIAYDNVRRTIQGEAIDSALTCNGSVAFRILGQSKIQTCDWQSIIVINGNQVRIGGDTRRRTVIGRIMPSEKRSYRHVLPKFAYQHRADFLGAAIAIVRAGLLGGVPRLDNRASFESFIRTIAGAVVAAGGHDITPYWREEEAVTESDDARDTMALWLALRWPDGATASQIADDLGEGFMPSPGAAELLQRSGLESRMREVVRYLAETYEKASKRQSMALALYDWRDIPSPQGIRITGQSGRGAVWRAKSS